MDLLNELGKLQSATDITGKTAHTPSGKKSKSKAPAPPVGQSLDALLSHLHELKSKLADGSPPSNDDYKLLVKVVDERKKDVEERQKEVYASLGRVGKLLDKVCVHA